MSLASEFDPYSPNSVGSGSTNSSRTSSAVGFDFPVGVGFPWANWFLVLFHC